MRPRALKCHCQRTSHGRSRAVAAFDPEVAVRPGARDAVAAASEHGAVGVCSNCAVPGLVRTTLVRADLRDAFDAIVASVACGWRKPDARVFERTADALDCEPADLVHVGDSGADAAIEALGGTFVDVRETPPGELADVVASLAASTASAADSDDSSGPNPGGSR